MPHDTNGPICQCGCGEGLPTGSPRRYKRGHLAAARKKESEGIIRQLQKDEGTYVPPTPETFNDLPTTWDVLEQTDPFAPSPDVPEDAQPDTAAREKADGAKIVAPDGTIVVTKAVARDIQGKLAFLMAMPCSMLAPLDPVCIPVLQGQIPELSARLTPIICQSPDMVQFFSKQSTFILWLSLGAAAWPVIQTVIAHHMTKTLSVDEKGHIHKKDYSGYPA